MAMSSPHWWKCLDRLAPSQKLQTGFFVVWALGGGGGCALPNRPTGKEGGRKRRGEGEQSQRPADAGRRLNKSLPPSETDRDGERGRRKMSDFLTANERKRKTSSRER